MKAILAVYGGDTYGIFTSNDLGKAMRSLWEEMYSQSVANDYDISEAETWFDESWAQVVSKNGEPIAEFRIFDVFDLDTDDN